MDFQSIKYSNVLRFRASCQSTVHTEVKTSKEGSHYVTDVAGRYAPAVEIDHPGREDHTLQSRHSMVERRFSLWTPMWRENMKRTGKGCFPCRSYFVPIRRPRPRNHFQIHVLHYLGECMWP